MDYARVLASAIKAIDKTGREVTISAMASAIDPTDPMGPATASALLPQTVKATFVQPSGIDRLGISTKKRELFRECEQIALVAGIEGVALDDYDTLTDSDTMEWSIMATERLQPGDVVLLYYIGVARK
jgi:hypothetical protein